MIVAGDAASHAADGRRKGDAGGRARRSAALGHLAPGQVFLVLVPSSATTFNFAATTPSGQQVIDSASLQNGQVT